MYQSEQITNAATKIFISYAREDKVTAEDLKLALGDEGYELLYDQQDISAGEAWKTRLGDLIQRADTVVFLLSECAADSDLMRFEINYAIENGKRIAPVVIRPFDLSGLPPSLLEHNLIDLYTDHSVPGSGYYYGLRLLRAVLRTDLEWLQKRNELRRAADRWRLVEAKNTDFLLRGILLDRARAWASNCPLDMSIEDDLKEFLFESEKVCRLEAREINLLREKAEARTKAVGLLSTIFASPSEPNYPDPKPRGNGIFISYRRSDSGHAAGRIYETLVQSFKNSDVFLDVDAIPMGVNFRSHIEQYLTTCGVMALIIGRYWTNPAWKKKSLSRRESKAPDFVEIELATALTLGIPIIPILVNEAEMPKPHLLSPEIRPVISRNAVVLGHGREYEKTMDAVSTRIEQCVSGYLTE